jgi:hypothetical protein
VSEQYNQGAPGPQGPGWWQASDGRWYPPQPAQQAYTQPAPQAYPPGSPQGYPQQAPPAPPPRTSGKGCLIALAIVLGLFLLVGIVFAVLAAFVWNRAEDALDEVANPEEAEDVDIDDCTTDESGSMVAELRVTNRSPEASNYFIEIAFETPDGDQQLATAVAFVTGLAPDQSTSQVASSLTEASGDFECRVALVERTSAET